MYEGDYLGAAHDF